MAQYILLIKLTSEGKERLAHDPDAFVRAHDEVEFDEVQALGMYGVLGRYDIVTMVEAEDNEAAARYSLLLSVRIGAHIETLPAVPLTSLERGNRWGEPIDEESVRMSPPRSEP